MRDGNGCDEIATYGGNLKFGIMSNDVIIKDCGGEFYEFVRNSKGTIRASISCLMMRKVPEGRVRATLQKARS